ncbi:AMP-binding protein [Streptomyces sp. NPDC059783]|uniref:AMP-binding protein n=1 Tax=Streptomyces sp. NPDC059783 TaxID=3346944 RepID=UPI0036657982
MTNLASVLTDAARPYPERPALSTGRSVLTLFDLDELSARVAGGLLAHGVRPGDRVELAVPGLPALPVLYYGALRAGAVAVVARPRPRLLVVRPTRARLRFATGEEAHAASTVLVGPGFLGQLAFWPQRPGVVHRDDEDPAVVVEDGTGRHTAYTHREAREAVAASGGGPLTAPGLPVPRPGTGGAVLHRAARPSAPLVCASGPAR